MTLFFLFLQCCVPVQKMIHFNFLPIHTTCFRLFFIFWVCCVSLQKMKCCHFLQNFPKKFIFFNFSKVWSHIFFGQNIDFLKRCTFFKKTAVFELPGCVLTGGGSKKQPFFSFFSCFFDISITDRVLKKSICYAFFEKSRFFDPPGTFLFSFHA